MPHVRSEIIPDIYTDLIFVNSETKYEIILKENNKNVSVIGLIRKKLQFLNIKLVRNPKNSPIHKESTPNIANSPRIMKGVVHVKAAVYRF